eukprot:g12010.t1
MSALADAPSQQPEGGEDDPPAKRDGRPGDGSGASNHSQQQQLEHEGDEEEEQHNQLQLLKETAQELERERFEEEEREARLRALRALTPEEYLQQTGVSSAMEKALGLLAGLRPFNPLSLFSDIMRDYARNTHPAVRQAKLLRYVVRPSARRGASALAAAATAVGADAGYPSPTKKSTNTTGGAGNKPPRDKNAALQNRRFCSQLEVLCQPLHRFLCGAGGGGKNSGFAMTDRDFDAFAPTPDNNYGGGGGGNRSEGPNRTAAGGGGTGANKPGSGTGGRVRGAGKGAAAGGGGCGGGNAAGDGGARGSGSGRAGSGGGGGGARGGGCARWDEVRRFLEALCRAAEIDSECISAAMAVLEREGRFSPSSCAASSPSTSSPSHPASASSSKKATGSAPVAGGGLGLGLGRGRGRWNPPETGVDFRRFVAAVRAVLLFEGFYREARQEFLEVTGRVDGSAPLDELLERLFPSDSAGKSSSGSGCLAREAIQERLDVGRRGETKASRLEA